jgi:hypothetical protein
MYGNLKAWQGKVEQGKTHAKPGHSCTVLHSPWCGHLEHQEDWSAPSWSSIALTNRSLLSPGVQDLFEFALQ